MTARIFSIALLFIASASTLFAEESAYTIKRWDISQKEAISEYLGNASYTIFKPYMTKEYENRMFMQIIQINPESGSHFSAVKNNTLPYRELLFLNGKFVMLTEEHSKMDDLTFKKIFVSLKDIYGLPQITKEKNVTMYTFKNDSATAVLHAEGNAPYEVKVFIYGKALFRGMFSGD
jgi:hypothetical protein